MLPLSTRMPARRAITSRPATPHTSPLTATQLSTTGSWLPPGANVLLFALVKVSFELFLSRCCVLVAAASVAWRVVTAGWWQLHRWLPLSWAVQAKRASLSQLTSATSFVVLVVSDSFWPTFALGEGLCLPSCLPRLVSPFYVSRSSHTRCCKACGVSNRCLLFLQVP